MLASTKACPDKNSLVDYLLGKLSDELLDRYESHFAVCADCEETIRGLNASDTLSRLAVEAVSDIEPDVDQGDTDEVKSLIDRLQNGPAETRRKICLDDRAIEVTQLLEPAPDELAIGQLAHYRILKLIGAGSTGVVYQAVDQQLDRMVALKVLRPSLGNPARERFMAEARSAAAIDHPNVITIYHVGVEGRLAYMAMQWLPGETLEHRLSRLTKLPEDEIRQMGVEISRGLHAAHEKNLIHRDIKPANIWLSEETGQAIILDFGLARIADDDPQLTSTGMLAGTPNFMSPEQTRGSEIDRRSDLFSLGCLMYRAATGKLPFGSTGILATLQAIQHHRPGAPRDLNPNLGTDFSDLIMCLLEKQPVNRPEDASQLITALEQPRCNWSFVASTASQPNEPFETQPKTKSEFRSGSVWFRWIAAALLIGLLGWSGTMWGPQIIRIMTDQGQLVIDTSDDDVEVEILDGGKVIAVIDTKTRQKINIKSGEYHVQLKGDQNSFELSPDHVVMMRGGKQIVTITRIKPDSSNLNSDPKTAASKRISREEGKSTQLPLFRPTDSQFDIKDAELDVLQARAELVRAEEVYQHSAELARKDFITQNQLQADQLALDAAKLKLQKSEQALERAKVNQQQNAAWQKQVDQILSRKLEVLEENLKAVKIRHKNGVVPLSELKKAELEYLDGKLQLLHGDAAPGDTGSQGSSRQKTENTDSVGPGPTYDGRTFEQWLAVLKTERNRDTIRSGLKALGELSRDDAEMQETAIAAVTPLIRRHGGNIIGSSDDELVENFNYFFGYFPPQRVIEFILDEIADGTLQSRKQLTWLLLLASVYEGRLEMVEKHRDALRGSFDSIWMALMKYVETSDGQEKELGFNLAGYLLRSCFNFNGFQEQPGAPLPELDPTESETISRLVAQKMNSTKDPEVAMMLAALLVRNNCDSDAAVAKIVGALTEGTYSDYLINAAFESINSPKLKTADAFVGPLIVMYSNRQLCDRISAYRDNRFLSHNRFLSGVIVQEDMRNTIIKTLGSFGGRAEQALDWLDKIAAGDSPQQYKAQKAAYAIRVDLSKGQIPGGWEP